MRLTRQTPAALDFRPITPGEIPAARRLLARLRPTIAGVSGPPVDRALCREAVLGGGIVLILAREGDRPAGFVAGVIDPARTWPALLRRHPGLGLRIALSRGLERVRRPRPAAARAERGETSPSRGPSAWDESSPEVARVILIGVDDEFRGQGVGLGLYDAFARELAGRGVRRLVARIDAENRQSLALHRRAGWDLEADPDGLRFLATLDLLPPEKLGD